MALENSLFKQSICKFKERHYGVVIEVAFRKSVLSCIGDPGLGNRENIILRLERIPALTVYFPDFQDGKAVAIKGMVGMEDCCCSQIPVVIECFLM